MLFCCCLFDLACFFLPTFSSLIKTCTCKSIKRNALCMILLPVFQMSLSLFLSRKAFQLPLSLLQDPPLTQPRAPASPPKHRLPYPTLWSRTPSNLASPSELPPLCRARRLHHPPPPPPPVSPWLHTSQTFPTDQAAATR